MSRVGLALSLEIQMKWESVGPQCAWNFQHPIPESLGEEHLRVEPPYLLTCSPNPYHLASTLFFPHGVEA